MISESREELDLGQGLLIQLVARDKLMMHDGQSGGRGDRVKREINN